MTRYNKKLISLLLICFASANTIVASESRPTSQEISQSRYLSGFIFSHVSRLFAISYLAYAVCNRGNNFYKFYTESKKQHEKEQRLSNYISLAKDYRRRDFDSIKPYNMPSYEAVAETAQQTAVYSYMLQQSNFLSNRLHRMVIQDMYNEKVRLIKKWTPSAQSFWHAAHDAHLYAENLSTAAITTREILYRLQARQQLQEQRRPLRIQNSTAPVA